MESLRADRGFLDVMRRKRWLVGALKEMPPEGRVGLDPVCVLGYNTNAGAEIHLRLRTDDEKGFRSITSIRQVLAHELAHNEFSDHDTRFKELMRWVEREVAKFATSERKGRTTGGVRAAPVGEEPLQGRLPAPGERLSIVRRLGGGEGVPAGAAAVRAAHEPAAGLEKELAAMSDGEPTASVEGEAAMTDAEPAVGPETEPAMSEAERDSQQVTGAGTTPEADVVPKADGAPDAKSARQRKVDELCSLGFDGVLCGMALRESGGSVARAADYLFGLSAGPPGGGSEDDATVARVRGAVGRLEVAGLERAGLADALDALHAYSGNLLRRPGEERFARINGRNAAFGKRVGGVGEAVAVLVAAGWVQREEVWIFENRDLGGVWAAKTLVGEALVRLLG